MLSPSGNVSFTSKRCKKVIFTPEGLSSLDRANKSDMQAVLTMFLVVFATEENINEYPLNCSREEKSLKVKREFQNYTKLVTI